MVTYLSLLLESHVCLLILVLVVYVIETLTGKLILVHWFKLKKDMKSAIGSADMESLLYFLFNIGFSIYKVYIRKSVQGNFHFVVWVVIVLVLSITVRKLYMKYQGIDTNKPDYMGMLKK